MKKPEGADADLGMPAADELWPRRTGTDADIDEAETAAHEQDTFLLAGDELPRPATLRTASMVIKPPTFPVAPPIPPLSLPVTPPVAAQADSQGPPTIIEGTQADAARLTSPPPGPTPRPA